MGSHRPWDCAHGYTAALSGVQQRLQWSGEIAAQIPTKTMALMQDRLLAEASTAAWQDYFVCNAWLAILCLFPALPCWRRTKYQAPDTTQASRPDKPTPTPPDGWKTGE